MLSSGTSGMLIRSACKYRGNLGTAAAMSVSQAIIRPVGQSVRWLVGHSDNESLSWSSVSQSVGHSVGRSGNKSISQPVGWSAQSVGQPVSESASQLVSSVGWSVGQLVRGALSQSISHSVGRSVSRCPLTSRINCSCVEPVHTTSCIPAPMACPINAGMKLRTCTSARLSTPAQPSGSAHQHNHQASARAHQSQCI